MTKLQAKVRPLRDGRAMFNIAGHHSQASWECVRKYFCRQKLMPRPDIEPGTHEKLDYAKTTRTRLSTIQGDEILELK